MKKAFLSFALILGGLLTSAAQNQAQPADSVQALSDSTVRVYAELYGLETNVMGNNKNVNVTVDLGQFQSSSRHYYLQDENGKDIKFNSMIDAMDYMGQRGWKFVQAYVLDTPAGQKIHWILYRDLAPGQTKWDGLRLKYIDEPAQK